MKPDPGIQKRCSDSYSANTRLMCRTATSDGTARIASMHQNNATDRPTSIRDIQDNA
jgi:hypothetical protein